MQSGRQMIDQEEHGLMDELVLDHMIVIQDEDEFFVHPPDLIEQVCQDGRERGSLL